MVQKQAAKQLLLTELWNYRSMLDTITWMVRQEGVGSLQQCGMRANRLGPHVATSDGAGGDGAGWGLTILPFILVQILHVMSM